METNSMLELLYNLNPTEDQIKEFFIYHASTIKETMVTGIETGLSLAGKDMESAEGKETMKIIEDRYEEKFAQFVQKLINEYCQFVIDTSEKTNLKDELEAEPGKENEGEDASVN